MKEKNEQIYEAGFQDGLSAAGISAPQRNDSAFIIGLIAGLFGIWGLAHVLNGKLGAGCLWMLIVGPLLGAILGGIVFATAGLGAIVILPLWLYIVYSQAKNGAT